MSQDKAVAVSANDAEYYSGVSGDSSWARLRRKAALTTDEGSNRWSNKDLDPVKPEFQTWRTYDFVTYWISDAFSVSNWRIGSSLIAIGLSWKLALVAIVLGNFVTALVVTFNGLIGARLHIPFTIQARSCFGFYFSYVMIVVRVIVSVFWYGIGTYNGAECVQSMLYAIWPSFRNIPNHLPKSANITTGFMICYFIYFVVVLPFHWIPPHKVRWVFTIKSIITPIAGFAILGYLVHATGGNKIFTFGNELKGSALGWGFMNGVNAMIGNFATLGVNMNDFARYSKKPKSPLIQLIVIPVVFLMMMIFGVVGANGSKILYGELLWDPLEIVDHWTSKGGRAAAFFCAAAFFIANIAINISANSIAVAVDLSALAPRYINIRRGQYICAFIGAWALTPWNILVSADSLLTFMDGYSVWLAPISSVLICDYYFVHHRLVAVHELYRPHGVYAYEKWGTNWRSAVAFVVGFAPLLPGFANAVTSSISVSTGAIHLYDLGYFYGFIVPGVLYVGLSRIFPPKSQYSLDGRTIQEEVREKVSIEEHRHGQPHFV